MDDVPNGSQRGRVAGIRIVRFKSEWLDRVALSYQSVSVEKKKYFRACTPLFDTCTSPHIGENIRDRQSSSCAPRKRLLRIVKYTLD